MARTRYKIIEGDTAPYFLTATVVNWLPVFNNPSIAKIIFDSLRFLQHERRMVVYTYVLMENHLHIIASAENLSKEIAGFKSYTARKSIDFYKAQNNQFILQQLSQHKRPHKTDSEYQFWQEGNQPKRIKDQAMMRQKIEYIHANPVQRGYVDAPEDWRYSSARNYAELDAMLEICLEW